MGDERSVSRRKTSTVILITLVIVVMACGILALIGQSLLDTWEPYDPKQSAQEAITHCLDGSKELCGYISGTPCWRNMQQALLETSPQYSIDILWYNWEDQIPNRGGDEVYMQVNFSNGTSFKILWYEGTIEACEAVTST